MVDSLLALIIGARKVLPLVQKQKSSKTIKADTICIVYRAKTKDKNSHTQEHCTNVLMLLRAITHWETSLHGMELVPSLGLCHGQRHHRTMTNAVEGDLPNADRDVLETSVDRGTLGIDSVYGRICRKLERFQLCCQG